MLKSIEIANYKSVEKLSINLGKVNVFIGENGAGKSNVLEAIALAGAAEAGKLDNEFLSSRGIRLTSAPLMRCAFEDHSIDSPISIIATTDGGMVFSYELNHDNQPYSSWHQSTSIASDNSRGYVNTFAKFLTDYLETLSDEERINEIKKISDQLSSAVKDFQQASENASGPIRVNLSLSSESPYRFGHHVNKLNEFVIFSPENTSLRTLEREGQIEPLGVNGEGLLRLLKVMTNDPDKRPLLQVKKALGMLSWFKDFDIIEDDAFARMDIKDRHLSDGIKFFDQRSANEGFLFVTFYFALFASSLTPKFFAIDNIDASLNPKLCEEMIRSLVEISKQNDKQAILTTHNPAVLDGLDLRDDDQRLFIVSRNPEGKTRVRRYRKPPPSDYPTRLSELFLRGMIGGLPKSF